GEAGANGTVECPASPTFTAPTASDASKSATIAPECPTPTAGSRAATYTESRTWHAIDDCGNTSVSRTQTITVRDTTAPTIGEAGANGTVECPASATITAPTASDACNSATIVPEGDTTTAGNCANTYTESRSWHAVDDCGNTSVSRTQTITVRDTTAPTIGQAGANGTVECPASPTFTAPT